MRLKEVETVRKYYETAELGEITNLKLHQVRIQLYSGKWLIFNRAIQNQEQLRTLLIKYTPKNAYYTISTFLQPSKVRGRITTWDSYPIILGNDFIVDLDHQNLSQIKLIELYCARTGIKISKVVDSGRGLHIYIDDPVELPKDARFRELAVRLKRMRQLHELQSIGVRLDPVTSNPYCIIRIPGSWNGNAGKPSKILTNSQNELDVLLSAVSSTQVTGLGNDQGTASSEAVTPVQVVSEAQISSHGPYKFLKYKYIDSTIAGTKDLHCVAVKGASIRRLKEAQKIYSLPDFYIMNNGWAISLKPVSARRLEKILKFCRADNTSSFIKYRHNKIRTSSCKGDFNNPKPIIVKILHSKFNSQKSLPHSELITHLGVAVEGNVGRSNRTWVVEYDMKTDDVVV